MTRLLLKTTFAVLAAALAACAGDQQELDAEPDPQVLQAFDWRDVQTRIDAKYASLTPDVHAALGAALRGAQPCDHHLLRNGFFVCGYQQFEGGRIYYQEEFVKEPHVIYGAIYERWLWEDRAPRGPGYAEGYIGLPATDELSTPDGRGRFNHFVLGNGSHSIYWTPEHGAIKVSNWARRDWSESGWERGPYGYPTGEEYANDGRCGPNPGYNIYTQNFERGFHCGELFRGWLVPYPQ